MCIYQEGAWSSLRAWWQAPKCMQADPGELLRPENPRAGADATPGSQDVWTVEPPADVTRHVAAFYATQAAALGPHGTCLMIQGVCKTLHQPRLSRSAAASVCVMVAVLTLHASAASDADYTAVAASIAKAVRVLHAKQGVESPPMLRVLLWGLRCGCPGAVQAVHALSKVLLAVPIASISTDGPLKSSLMEWMQQLVPLRGLVLQRAHSSCLKHAPSQNCSPCFRLVTCASGPVYACEHLRHAPTFPGHYPTNQPVDNTALVQGLPR
jgi:hypothetical protein